MSNRSIYTIIAALLALFWFGVGMFVAWMFS